MSIAGKTSYLTIALVIQPEYRESITYGVVVKTELKQRRMKLFAGVLFKDQKSGGGLYSKKHSLRIDTPGMCSTAPTTERLTRELIVAEVYRRDAGQLSKGFRDGSCQ